MENSSPLILDISSDEEAGFSETGGGVFDDSEDHDWLSELLGEVDSDDSDEVVVISEVFPNAPEKSILHPLKSVAEVVDKEFAGDDGGSGVDDDDCVVLDGDPEKSVLVGNGKADGDGDDSDDLEIVGEKGEIACRDFPHPRHLCVTHVFASTPHEVHCSQCHCYVCDVKAPCNHWGSGISGTDHCHATEKEGVWRAERKSRKEGDKPVPALYCISNTFVTTEAPTHFQSQPSTSARPCFMSSNRRTPIVVNQGRSYPFGRSFPRYKPQQQSVSPQLHSTVHSYVTSQNNSYNTVNRSSRFFPSRAQFKRTRVSGASPNNRFRYYSGYSGSLQRRSHALSAPRLNGYQFSNQGRIGNYVGNSTYTQLDSSVPLPPNNHVKRANYNPYLPQIHSPPTSSFRSPSQPNLGSNNSVNVVPFQPQVASHPIVGNIEQMDSLFPPHRALSSHSTSVISSQPNMCSTFETQSSQPLTYDNIISGQNNFQQGGQTQSGLDMNAADFGFGWDVSHGPGNSQAPAGASQLQISVRAHTSHNLSILEDHHQDVVPVDKYHKQHVAPIASASLLDATDFHFSGIISTKPMDVQLDDWMFENPSSPGAFEVPLSPYWGASSPEPIDAGTLFDI